MQSTDWKGDPVNDPTTYDHIKRKPQLGCLACFVSACFTVVIVTLLVKWWLS